MDETRAHAEEAAATRKAAEELGEEYGKAGGSWVVDGNSSTETLEAVIDASEAGEFWDRIVPEPSGPLSGEYAGTPTPGWLAEELGVDDGSDEFDDLCSIFEGAYFRAFEDEAVRAARAMLPEEAES